MEAYMLSAGVSNQAEQLLKTVLEFEGYCELLPL